MDSDALLSLFKEGLIVLPYLSWATGQGKQGGLGLKPSLPIATCVALEESFASLNLFYPWLFFQGGGEG